MIYRNIDRHQNREELNQSKLQDMKAKSYNLPEEQSKKSKNHGSVPNVEIDHSTLNFKICIVNNRV